MNSLRHASHYLKQFNNILLIVIFTITIPNITYSGDNTNLKNTNIEKYKDPIIAGALSWYSPGMGQIYVGNTTRGSIIFITEWTLIMSSIFVYADLSLSLGGKKGFSIAFIEKKEDSDNLLFRRKNISIALLSLTIVLHIYNIIDAISLANKYNRNLINVIYKSENSGNKLIEMSINNAF